MKDKNVPQRLYTMVLISTGFVRMFDCMTPSVYVVGPYLVHFYFRLKSFFVFYLKILS